jgi:hypothetical protein
MLRLIRKCLAISVCVLLAGCFEADGSLFPQDSDDLGIGSYRVGKMGTGAEQKPFQFFLVKGVYVMTGSELDEPLLNTFHRIGPTAYLVQSGSPESKHRLFNILDTVGAPSYQLIQLGCQDFEAGVLAKYQFEISLGFCEVADGPKLMDFAKGVIEGRIKPIRDLRRYPMVLEASE